MVLEKEVINSIREKISPNHIFSFLEELGAEPRYEYDNIVAKTICHEGESHKLYYYINNQMFHCYTNCGTFDIFELVKKVKNIDNFYNCVLFIVQKFQIEFQWSTDDFFVNNNEIREQEKHYFSKLEYLYNKIQQKNKQQQEVVLKEYDASILDRFMYPIIAPWEREGISREVIKQAKIGYFPGGGQITIPHFDINNRLVGIRGRQLGQEEAQIFGKYRPLFVNGQLYNHPLGFNLYNLNNSKDNIKKMKKAFIFESEKSTLLYRTYFGIDNDLSTACCGSSISDFQIQSLINCGAEEICIAFDRQFQEIGDEEFKKLTRNILKINSKYKNLVKISFIFDKKMITEYKSSPVDESPNKFLQLYKDRLFI